MDLGLVVISFLVAVIASFPILAAPPLLTGTYKDISDKNITTTVRFDQHAPNETLLLPKTDLNSTKPHKVKELENETGMSRNRSSGIVNHTVKPNGNSNVDSDVGVGENGPTHFAETITTISEGKIPVVVMYPYLLNLTLAM